MFAASTSCWTKNLDLKVANWAGATIDGSQSNSCYHTTHRLLCVEGKGSAPIVDNEIFGLGSALHNIVVGHEIFSSLNCNDETIRLFDSLKITDSLTRTHSSIGRRDPEASEVGV